jgi:hypothetical protein
MYSNGYAEAVYELVMVVCLFGYLGAGIHYMIYRLDTARAMCSGNGNNG